MKQWMGKLLTEFAHPTFGDYMYRIYNKKTKKYSEKTGHYDNDVFVIDSYFEYSSMEEATNSMEADTEAFIKKNLAKDVAGVWTEASLRSWTAAYLSDYVIVEV